MGRKIPAAASETPVAPSQAPAAKSRPRSPSQPSTARPVLRSRRSVSLSRQNDSPPDAAHAESGRRFIDVVRASLSPDAGRKGTGRHSGRDQSKGKGKGKRSPSREERAPSVELVLRESIRPTQSNVPPPYYGPRRKACLLLHRLMRSTRSVHVAPRAVDQASLPIADIPAEKASEQSRATPKADIPAKARARARTPLVTQVLALAQWTLHSTAPSTVLAQLSSSVCG